MYPEKPNLVDPRKISDGSYAAGVVLSDEMQLTLNQTQCRPVNYQLFYPYVDACTAFVSLTRSRCSGKVPSKKYSGPVTEAQEIGWFHEELVRINEMSFFN
jgi:hypothetical protein